MEHVDTSAPMQINVDEVIRVLVQKDISEAEIDCFDRAQKQVIISRIQINHILCHWNLNYFKLYSSICKLNNKLFF